MIVLVAISRPCCSAAFVYQWWRVHGFAYVLTHPVVAMWPGDNGHKALMPVGVVFVQKIMKTMRWKVSCDYGRTFQCYSSLAVVSPILAEFGITASASRLYNEVLDVSHRASGIKTPQHRVRITPRVVICRIDKE